MKRIFIISGEKSGDIIANSIIKKIQHENPKIEIRGVGGESFFSNGLKSLFEQKELSIMGFIEIIPKIFRIMRLLNQTISAIEEFNPSDVLTIDSPGFNFIIAKRLKKRNFQGRVHHVVAPSVWAYKKRRAKKVAKLYDTLFCILPFEPKYFTPLGLKTIFVGYPPFARMQKVLEKFTLESRLEKSLISITLGSRSSEVRKHAPIIHHTIKLILEKYPNIHFNILTLEHLQNEVEQYFSHGNNITITSSEQEKWQSVIESKFVIGKSGTNIMEFALLGTPSIVFYKTSFVTGAIVKFLAYTKFVTLLNFTANRWILPEFLQSNATPENLSCQAIAWLKDCSAIQEIKQEMQAELQKFASNQSIEEIIYNEICS